jgi:predicted Zn-dependent protease
MSTVHLRAPVVSTICLVARFVFVGCTVRAQQSCSVTLPTRIPTAANIFSAQQERMLGDIEVELLESNNHAAYDEELAAHLNAVAGRVLSQFSCNQVLVHVIVIDTPEAESFGVAPERIYITRKMLPCLGMTTNLPGDWVMNWATSWRTRTPSS